jgi:hypothetical protein
LPKFIEKVWPHFIRGEYDVAILQALKIVEIEVRKKCKYDNNKLGVALMRDAFHPQDGPLLRSS